MDMLHATLLHVASEDSSALAVKKLLDAGADVNHWGEVGSADDGEDDDHQMFATPLFLAAAHGREGMVDALLAAGADVNRIGARCVGCCCGSDAGSTALRIAVHRGHVSVAEKLMDGGGDVNHRDSKGTTALFVAVMYAAPAMVALLVRRGADVHAVAIAHRVTPLLLALHRGHSAIVALLQDAGAVHPFTRGGNRRCCYTCRKSGCKLKYCSLCKLTLYCGPDCQSQDWSAHKKACKAIRALENGAWG